MFKKRKLISIMLTISMMLTLFPFAAFAEEAGAPVAAPEQAQEAPAQPAASSAKVAEVNGTQYDTLSAAINAVNDGETIKLLDNVSESTAVSVDNGKTFSMDLNSKVLTLANRMVIKSAFVTVQNGTVKGDIQVNVTNEDAVYNSFTLAQNAAIDGDYGIIVAQKEYGANNFGSTVNVNGKITGTSSALWVLGNITTDWKNAKNPVVVNVGSTAVLTNPDVEETALQMAGSCVVTIADGAQITGGTAVEVRAGKLVVNGGTITGTGTPTSSHPNGSGTSTVGAGIAIAQHATKLPIDVVVNGGAIKGHTGFYVTNPQNNGEVNQVTATINGGDFVTTGTNAVAKDENAKNAGVAVAGGSFTGNLDESFLAEGFEAVQGSDGKLTVTVDTKSEATWTENGVKKAGTLDAAIKALKDQGGTIEVLKDATITDAKYVINNKITLQKSASATTAPKIDVTVASGETTKAFEVKQGAGLTLDGVTMTINGTENADTAKKNDGTGIDIYNSTNQDVAGAILTLKNGAVLNLTNLERATIASSTPASAKVVNQSIVTLEPGTTMNITNIDGNGANGGDWIVDGATLNVDGCGSYGVSAQTVTAKNNANVNVKNVGISGVTAKDIAIENGSQVNVTQSGTKLPFTDWKGNQVNDVVTLKDQGSLTLDKDSKLALTDNKVNTFGPGNGTVGMAGQFIGEMNAPAPDSAKNEVRITYTVNGDVYKSFVATKSGDTVTFTEPSAPSVAGYTFKGWNYGKAVVQVADGQVTLTPATETTFIFTADLVANAAPSPSYQVDVATADNGSVTVTPQRASAGKTVTITATPDEGYVVDVVTVTDKDGKSVEVVKKADGTYTFTMPKGAVTVKVSFKAEATAPNALPFTDVHESDWFYGPVVYAYEHGIMNGTGDGTTFSPNVPLNRAMIAAVLYNLEGGPAVDNDGAFSDVPSGQWYTDAVNWAASEGIVGGIGDGLYAPNANLTREQMASVLYRYAQYKGIDVSKRADLATFVDGTTVSPWATEVVEWAVAEKLINGTAGNTLQPQGTATRAQVATVLMNFCENVAK